MAANGSEKAFCVLTFHELQLSSGNSAPNSGNNHHLTIPFEGGMHSFKRRGACVKGKAVWNELDFRVDVCRITFRAPVRYVTKNWSVVLLNKKYIYSYLKCIVYDKLLKPRQSF